MITGYITHDESVIEHFMEDPELAEIMLDEAINDEDWEEVKIVWRRMKEAKSRLASQAMPKAV